MNAGENAKARKAYLAVITRWLPAEDEVLFHAVHDDGDEEDLDEVDARKAAAIYSRQPDAAKRKHEMLVEREAKRQRAEAKARIPRKPRSAYACFAEARRAAMMLEQPGLSFAQLSAAIAAEWRSLDDNERAVHDAASAADLKRYVSECEAVGVDPGHAAILARGPLPALSAAAFFRGRCEATMGVSLSATLGCEEGEMAAEVAALLARGVAELSYEERDELDDVAGERRALPLPPYDPVTALPPYHPVAPM